ncbi:MAG: HAD family phosphatase [Clostridium sp.]|nr:HAD family phosphatase [Clostridium sp.]MCM1398788.1 HAD family phosphatase [Clostridium sp.]MCM1458580.1 HAD family phosphatase [Bacteroides sp.]
MFELDKIIGVIFDFNGTMLFDAKYHIEAWSLYVEEITGVYPDEITKKEYIINKSAKDILEHFLGYEISKDTLEQLSDEKEHIYRRLIAKNKLTLAPGLVEFLDYLDKYNIPRTMATMANLSNVMYYFETFDLYRWFDPDKIVYHDKRLRDKPFPDLYLVASKMIKIPPKSCIVFEDSETGILAAINAGVENIVAITGDSTCNGLDNLKQIRACIHDFTELKEELEIKNM